MADEFVIQYRRAQARFRVTWIAARDESSEKQIGPACLEPGKHLWGERFNRMLTKKSDGALPLPSD